MRYENYQKRITKIADVLRTVLRKWPLFLLLFTIVVAAISSFIIFKGTVISVNCAPSIPYGDEIDCKAIAFFSKTHFEYCTDSGEWSKDAPVMPGKYQLRVVGNGFFEKKTSNSVSFTIEKRKVSIHSVDGTVNYGENPILSADLAYNDVVECSEFEAGEIFVKDGSSDAFITMAPEKSAIVIKNINGTDVTFAYDISVEREDLKIIPRKITVTVESASKIYDGMAFSFDGYELSHGTLADGDSLFAYFTKSIVNAGSIENTPNLVLVDESGIDVTRYYNISVVKGMLTVEKRPLILKTESGEFNYDGTPRILSSYEISDDTPLAEGQTLSLIWSGQTDAGEYNNIPTAITVSSENATDTTNNYSVFLEAGTLKINPLPITVETPSKTITYQGSEQNFRYFGFDIVDNNILNGHYISAAGSSAAIDVGKYENDTSVKILDVRTGVDVTHNYDITYIRGTIEIQKLHLVISTSSGEWTYDGSYHYKEEFTSGFVGYNDKIIVTEGTPVLDVGTYSNKLSVMIVREAKSPEGPADGTITPEEEENYVDVSYNYDIIFVYGTLTVNKRPVTLKPVDASKVYDGAPLTSTVLQVSPKSENDLLIGHTIFSAQTSGNQTDAGTHTNYIIPSTVVIHDADGNDVTHNYEMSLSVGLLTVKPRQILIQTTGAVKKYDGSALTNKHFTVVTESYNSLIDGHVLSVETIGSISRVGKTENICRLDKTRISDANGKDVTENYLIEYSYGILEVYGDSNSEYTGGFNESGTIGSFRVELTSQKEDASSLLSIMDERNGYIYLRLKSFGGYAGNTWHEATEYPELLYGQYSANYLSSLALFNNTRELKISSKNPYFFMPYYTLAQDTTDHIGQVSDVIYTGTEGANLETLYTVSYRDYDYSSQPSLPEEYAEFEEAYRAFVYSQYLIMDDETRAYMDNIIDAQKFFDKDIETILNVAQYVQNSAIYKIDYDEDLDNEENVAIAFLESYRVGSSQHFATALTLLYRAMGIPARYTIGYATPTIEGEWVEVDRSRIHAWVEVYIDGVGWIEIEATGNNGFGLNGSGGRPQKQEITVKPSYQCKTYDNKVLNATPIIEYDPVLNELASMGYYWSVNVSGSINKVGRGESIPSGFILYDPYGHNVTNQYNIIYENGILEIFEADAVVIKIVLSQLQKYYDGTPLLFEKSDYNIESNISLTGFDISIDISLTDVGYLTLSDLNENLDKYITVKYDPATSNIRPNQRVVVMFESYSSATWAVDMTAPIIRIDPKPITVVASSASKRFDGTPLINSSTYLAVGSLCDGHKMTVTVVGSIENIGTAENEIIRVVITNENGEDVTSNYDITKINGTLTVYK